MGDLDQGVRLPPPGPPPPPRGTGAPHPRQLDYQSSALPTELIPHNETGLAGFEPANAAVKVLCLTAWR